MTGVIKLAIHTADGCMGVVDIYLDPPEEGKPDERGAICRKCYLIMTLEEASTQTEQQELDISSLLPQRVREWGPERHWGEQ